MFKVLGCIFVLVSAVILFSGRILSCYFTAKMMDDIADVCKRFLFERNANLTYEQLFEKADFNADKFIQKYANNPYVTANIKNDVLLFLNNLGRRDNDGEEKYIIHNLERFEDTAQNCHTEFRQKVRVYPLCGLSFGMFVVIFLF